MKTKIFAWLFALTLFSGTGSHLLANSKFSRAELSADLDTLYYTMRETHPDLFFIMPRPEFERELERVRGRLVDSMTRLDFYSLTAPLTARLGDGHTAVWFSKDDFELTRILPYTFEIDAAEVLLTVAGDLSSRADPIPAGARIVSVNGVPAQQLIRELLPLISGESEGFRMQYLALGLPYFHHAHYRDTVFLIEYQTDGVTQSRRQVGIYAPEYERRAQTIRTNGQEDPYSLRIDEQRRVAVIDLRAFVYEPASARAFLDSTFSLIREKGIGELVIDIRRNGGGNSSLGDEFFQYISPVPFAQFGTVKMKYGEPMARWERIPDLEVGKVYTYGESEDDLTPLRDNPLRYTGNTYLLTSNYTFSSATDFAWAFQYFGMGTVIGEETGGWVVTFGDVMSFKLPNTGLDFGVSFKEFHGYGASEDQRHGVRPDHPVPASEAMDKAMELIELGRAD